jgi:predicted TPR repeat methyltransferase
VTIASSNSSDSLQQAIEDLEIAFPAPGDELNQDEEWVVVKVDDDWRRIRLHDYDQVFAIPGLYEKWVYEVFQCQSPTKIRELLANGLELEGRSGADLVVFDLGAGNGCVADELRALGAGRFVGVDIYQEAADAADRDRPGLYDDYVVGDLTDLPAQGERTLDRYDFNCLVCVAALGFGDIPPEVFLAAYDRIEAGAWVAFTIKSDFLQESDSSGFSTLIRRMLADGRLELIERETYTHRVTADATELKYEAFVGRKREASRTIA